MIADRALLEQRIGYVFQSRELLEEALTHASFRNESTAVVRDNERLEFLGDAVLDLVIAELLWKREPRAGEGMLTRARASLVNESSLGAAGRRIGLGAFLNVGLGEESAGGRDRDSLLADALEAVLAVVFLEAGLEVARGVVARLFEDFVSRQLAELAEPDPRSQLQEITQRRRLGIPRYEVLEDRLVDGVHQFDVRVSSPGCFELEATGASKKEASTNAARKAVALLKERDEDPAKQA